MPRHRLRPAMCIEFADARPDDDCTGQRNNSAHRVNHARTREVHCAMAKAPIQPTLSQPTTTPDPIAHIDNKVAQPKNRTEQKFFHAQRSAMAPVGIVAVVSMKTIMKKNSTMTAASLATPVRNQPFVPIEAVSKCAGSFTSSVHCCTQSPTSIQHRQAGTE